MLYNVALELRMYLKPNGAPKFSNQNKGFSYLHCASKSDSNNGTFLLKKSETNCRQHTFHNENATRKVVSEGQVAG